MATSEIKDFTSGTDIANDLVSRNSVLHDFDDFTDALAFDKNFEEVPIESVAPNISGPKSKTGWGDDAEGRLEVTGYPLIRYGTIFESSGRFITTVGGTGGAAFGSAGVQLTTGATATSYVQLSASFSALSAGNLPSGSGSYSASIEGGILNPATGLGSAYFGIGAVSVDGTSHNFASGWHIGFKIIKSGGVVSLYATQCNNAGEVASSVLTTLNDASNNLDLLFKVNGINSVDYYYRKTVGSTAGTLVGPVTLIGEIPVSAGTLFEWSVSNNGSAVGYSFYVLSTFYERR